MFEMLDPKTLTDEQLMERLVRCRKYASMVTNTYGMADSIYAIMTSLEEEMNYRNSKKYMTQEKEDTGSDLKPINLGKVHGE